MQDTSDYQQAAKALRGDIFGAELPPLSQGGGAEGVQKSGLLVIDKPIGITSFDVIRIARKRLQTKKIGHAGTLDPFASGVLLLAVNNATKALSSLLKAEKTYLTTIVFGVDSDTLDRDGRLEFAAEFPDISATDIERAVQSFCGEIAQVPPQYSAIKINGKPAYKHARKGEIVELQPKTVMLHKAELLDSGLVSAKEFAGRPYATLRLTVGSGFYVRSFARDLGKALKTTAICTQLRRESVGRFALAQAIAPDEIMWEHVFSLQAGDFPFAAITLDQNQYADFCHGKRIVLDNAPSGKVSLFIEEQWCGFGEVENGSLQPKTVIHL